MGLYMGYTGYTPYMACVQGYTVCRPVYGLVHRLYIGYVGLYMGYTGYIPYMGL